MDPVIDKVLGSPNFNFTQYVNDTITLSKSIVVKNNTEALLYNDFIRLYYPKDPINNHDKTTWRYYKHLVGEYHPLDKPITLTSLDNGSTIYLTTENLAIHQNTRSELIKFEQFYEELVKNYPEQELFIKSILNKRVVTSIDEVVNSDDYTIVSYSDQYVENQEVSLIYSLQSRLNNFKNIWLIPYYNLSDSLFLSTQYAILYQFFVTSLLAIRYQTAKTQEAHSFHIKNYFASHFGIDIHYDYLTFKQVLYLYNNLLYLKNHSGMNYIFKSLVENLFTASNIAFVTYDLKQLDSSSKKPFLDYAFYQRLLNSKDFYYNQLPFSLDQLSEKEYPLARSNQTEYDFNKEAMDTRLKTPLFNELYTKDLEAITYDVTDAVPVKFLTLLTDYWAYHLHNNNINFVISINEVIKNNTIKLNVKDAFKLYLLVIYASVLYGKPNPILTTFPSYRILNVLKRNKPNQSVLFDKFLLNDSRLQSLVNKIFDSFRTYPNTIASANQFSKIVDSFYQLEIGYWVFESNCSDMYESVQSRVAIDYLHHSVLYTPETENTATFLERIGFDSLYQYNHEELNNLAYSLLNAVYDNRLDFLNYYKHVQEAMVEIFKHFESYSTQIITNYYQTSPYLVGTKDVRFHIDNLKLSFNYFVDTSTIYYDLITQPSYDYHITTGYDLEFRQKNTYSLFYVCSKQPDVCFYENIPIEVRFTSINVIGLPDTYVIGEISEDDLRFLAFEAKF